MKKVSVVGGGIGGLAVAIRMAIRGYNVSLFEKSEQLGGKMGQIKGQGYRFDTGPSLFTKPHLLEELILMCNKEPNEYFHYNKLYESCLYFFEEQTMIIGYSDSKLLAKELSKKTNIGLVSTINSNIWFFNILSFIKLLNLRFSLINKLCQHLNLLEFC